MITAAVIITLLYLFTMLFLLYGFFQVPGAGKISAPKTHFSIVIPYRDEADNLPRLFSSILKLEYPVEMFEILAVNDASQDHSEALWRKFGKENPELQVHLLENVRRSGSPKKDAIEEAISVSQGEYIITTDADCELPENWLREMNTVLCRTNAAAVAAPVALKNGDSKMTFLRGFQELEILSLQAVTIGGFGVNIPLMCNGANFCYSKKAFYEVNGFEGNDEHAGGDDIFLLEKFYGKGLKTIFLKSTSAIVRTNAAQNWSSLISQRIRWAAKAGGYQNPYSKGLGLLVFSMNFLLIIVAAGTAGKIFPVWLLSFMFLAKFNMDFIFILKSAQFFGRERTMKHYFLSSIFYPFFSSFVALSSFFKGFEWKGRKFKK